MIASHTTSTQQLIRLLQNPEEAAQYSLREWNFLLIIARNKNLLARLAEALEPEIARESLPEPVCTHLKSALLLSRHQRQGVIWETKHIAKALSSLQIPVVLLKGAAYVLGELKAARGRLFGDIDILIPRTSINHVEANLMQFGWTSDGVDPYDQRYYREWMHELPPMVHRLRGTSIDVHHNILPTTAKNSPNIAPFLQAAMPLPGSPFAIPAPCDLVLHSSTHLFYEGDLGNGLRDLIDIDLLLAEYSDQEPDFWQTLRNRAVQTGLVVPLYLALRYSRIVLGTLSPVELQFELESQSKISHHWLGALDFAYLSVLNSSCLSPHSATLSLSRLFLYLRAHTLRMPPLLLIKHLARKAALRAVKSTSRSN